MAVPITKKNHFSPNSLSDRDGVVGIANCDKLDILEIKSWWGQDESQNRKILLSLDQRAAHLQDTRYLKNVKVMFFPTKTTPATSIPRDNRISRSFKHYYHKQLVTNSVSTTDQKLHHDATPML